MEIINDFGINPVLLTAQIVNFLILFVILRKILFKPLLKTLEERKQRITQSLKEAEQVSAELAEAEKTSKQIVQRANQQADQLVQDAKKIASDIRSQALLEAKAETELVFAKNKQALELEKEKMRSSLRHDLMEVVVMVTEKMLNKSLSAQEKAEITKKSLKELN